MSAYGERASNGLSPCLRPVAWGALVVLLVLAGIAGSVVPVYATIGRIPPVADAYIASGFPTESNGAKPAMWVGYDPAGGYQVEEALIGFSPAALPPAGSAITSARLYLYLGGTTPNDAPLDIAALCVTGNWDENVTWNSRPATEAAAPGAVTSVASALGWYSWDVTAALQQWSNARDASNFGLLLRASATGQRERSFRTREHSITETRPYLEFDYTPPTPTPTATPTVTPTATPSGPWAEYRTPNAPLLLPLNGLTQVVIDYRNATPTTMLTATVDGAALFENGETQLSIRVPAAGSGTITLILKPRPTAQAGAVFHLSAQLDGFILQPDPLGGAIARVVYLPLLFNRFGMNP